MEIKAKVEDLSEIQKVAIERSDKPIEKLMIELKKSLQLIESLWVNRTKKSITNFQNQFNIHYQ